VRIAAEAEQDERERREGEHGQLVPDTSQRDGETDRCAGEAPGTEHGERKRHPDCYAAGRDVGRRGRGLRDDERLLEPKPRQRRHPRRCKRDEVEDRRAGEQCDVRPGEILDHTPDVAVVGDLRQDESEGRDDDGDRDPHAENMAPREAPAPSGRHVGFLGLHRDVEIVR
jgi:hypothetical protein